MSRKNRYGLTDYKNPEVKREIRRRSKFGCVVCRTATSQYEHIEPEFKDAKEHDPEKMCLLCGRCHDKVNRGIFSKDFIWKKYEEVQYRNDIDPAKDIFDLHTEQAELLVAGNEDTFAPGITFSVYGNPVFQANPTESESGEIFADFTDENGRALFRIIGNQWVAFDDAWDVDITGNTFSVYSSEDLKVLQLKADPPGKIVVEHVDMRIGPIHLMATKNHFIVGRYVGPDSCLWLTASVDIGAHSPSSALIEATPPQGENFSINPTTGVSIEPAGISIAPGGSSLLIKSIAYGVRSVHHVREYFFEAAEGGDTLDLIDGQHLLHLKDLDAFSLIPPQDS